ncbi:MAG: cytochrome c peroxidase [Saprospiraceae bacterium]|nr:cytochrome-c peroxidase [Lewinella sp.]
MKTLLIIFSCLLFLAGCTPVANEIPEPNSETSGEIIQRYFTFDLSDLPDYSTTDLPAYFPPNILQNDNTPANNRITDIGATLGRVLFYDKNLSVNNTVSCASCHQQELGFSDVVQFSEGHNAELTGAHSMRLANTNFYLGPQMFWNKRAADLEEQTTQPIQDHKEMGFDVEQGGIDALIEKLEQLEYYPILFEQAFGQETITEERMQMALAQFIRSMISVDSKFDRGAEQAFDPAQPGNLANAPFPNFTAEENRGKRLFFNPIPQGGVGCAGCHQPPTFALDANSLNNGLDRDETTVFKSPSLKNVAITGPYMHDGRFATLQEVIEHYNSGIRGGTTLDSRLQLPNTNQPLRLNLSDEDKAALADFLRTLTDDQLISDERFSDPFK